MCSLPFELYCASLKIHSSAFSRIEQRLRHSFLQIYSSNLYCFTLHISWNKVLPGFCLKSSMEGEQRRWSSYPFLCFDVSINNRGWTRNELVDENLRKWKNRIGIPPFVWLQGEKELKL